MSIYQSLDHTYCTHQIYDNVLVRGQQEVRSQLNHCTNHVYDNVLMNSQLEDGPRRPPAALSGAEIFEMSLEYVLSARLTY